MASESAYGRMGREGGGCHKTVQGSVDAPSQREETRLHAGPLVIERGHANERTWPLRETNWRACRPLEARGTC